MKKRRILAVLLIVALAVASFSGCGKKKEKEDISTWLWWFLSPLYFMQWYKSMHLMIVKIE